MTPVAHAALSDERVPDSDAHVTLGVHGFSRWAVERWLDAKLKEVRTNPEAALAWLEEGLLRALSDLGSPGPEHGKQTGRRAGGGKLVKGS